MSTFDSIFSAVSKDIKNDALASVHRAGDISIKSHIPFGILTGIPELDFNIGRPGWPAGRPIELFGFEHCTVYDTFIRYSIRSKNGVVQNCKGGTIESLYHKFHNIPRKGKGKYLRKQTETSEYYAPSINEDDVIIQNKIIDVVKTGRQPCFELKTKLGKTLRATSNHRFYTGNSYLELSKLNVGDTIFIHNSTRYTGEEKKKQETRQSYYIDNHPYFTKTNGIRKYRVIYEANLNGIAVDEYLLRLNLNKLEGLKFVSNEYHIHHLDGDHTNNSVNNLTPLTISEHRKHHALTNKKNLGFIAIPDKITSISTVGVQSTYDIKMEAPYHNYIADGLVVHNCGKTTLAYHAIAQAQRMGGGGFFIDTEKSWDEDRASQIGVDTANDFAVGDADSVEGAFRIVQSILKARLNNNDGKPFIIVIDSITGTATESMKAKEMGAEERLGQDARAIRGGMRRIGPDVAESKVNLFMINHAISTIPKFKYAKQSEAAGGHAIKLFSTVRCFMANLGWIKDEKIEGKRLGQRVGIKVEKLKGSRLDWPEVKELRLLNTIGFDTEDNLLTAGIKAGWIDHSKGSKTYKFGELDFPKADWPAVVEDHGGTQAAYKEFIDWCIEDGSMLPWSQAIV